MASSSCESLSTMSYCETEDPACMWLSFGSMSEPCTIDMDPVYMDHVDMRAQEKADNRLRKQKQKYYAYRGVKPSWVGQKYYDVILITEETVSWSKSRKIRCDAFHPSAVIEHEHPDRLNRAFNENLWLSYLWSTYINVAIAEARHRLTKCHPEHRHESFTPQYDDVDTIEAPETLDWIYENLKTYASMQWPPDARFKLKVRTWTKKDSFDNKTCFTGGPDRRHSRGKRKFREKRLQKWNMRVLQRNAKSRLVTGDDVYEAKEANEDFADSMLDLHLAHEIIRDPPQYPIEFGIVVPRGRPLVETIHTVYDPYWFDSDDDDEDFNHLHNRSQHLRPEEWNEVRSYLAPTYYPERYIWGAPQDDDTSNVDPVQAYTVRFVPKKRRRSPVPPVYTPATSDAQSEYEPSLADEQEEDDFWDAFASSLNSSGVVVVSRPGADTGEGYDSGDDDAVSDFDHMSDLADAIVDVEWDVLSESSMALFA